MSQRKMNCLVAQVHHEKYMSVLGKNMQLNLFPLGTGGGCTQKRRSLKRRSQKGALKKDALRKDALKKRRQVIQRRP